MKHYILLSLLLVSACGGGGGGGSSNPTPVVNPSPPPEPIIMFTTSSEYVAVKSEFTLNWSVQNLSSCVMRGDHNSTVDVVGSKTIKPVAIGTLTYELTCGNKSETIKVDVLPEYTVIPDPVFADVLHRLGVEFNFQVVSGQVLTKEILRVRNLCLTSDTSNYVTQEPDSYNKVLYLPSFSVEYETWCVYTNGYITDMTGIENMRNLRHVRIEKQKIASIQINTLKKLKEISLWGNPITNIDVSENSNLETLGLPDTSITSLIMPELPSIKQIEFHNTSPTPFVMPNGTIVHGVEHLDVTKVKNLRWLYAWNNRLKTLDLTQNKTMREDWGDLVNLEKNGIESIFLSKDGTYPKFELGGNPSVQIIYQ